MSYKLPVNSNFIAITRIYFIWMRIAKYPELAEEYLAVWHSYQVSKNAYPLVMLYYKLYYSKLLVKYLLELSENEKEYTPLTVTRKQL